MTALPPFLYFIKKSPLARFFIIAFSFAILLFVSFFISIRVWRKPVIEKLSPQLASPGDIVKIYGKHFGSEQGRGFVSFGKSRLTASAYLNWSDNEISLVLPLNVEDGLVYVSNGKFFSKPTFFANERTLPHSPIVNTKNANPLIANVSKEKLCVGEVLVISGEHFGDEQNASAVYFSSGRLTNSEGNFLREKNNATSPEAVSLQTFFKASTYDYELWSENEIRVRIPDGSASGAMFVETEAGQSSHTKLTIDTKSGEKKFSSPHTYIIQLANDIENISAAKNETINVYIPTPPISSAQNFSEITECIPEPFIKNYENCVFYQLQVQKKFSQNKQRFSENCVVSVYEVQTKVAKNAGEKSDAMNEKLFSLATQADSFVPANDERIKNLATEIVGNEKNNYQKAKKIYDYLLENFSLSKLKTKSLPLDALKNKKADAYDFAILAVALLRSLGIPSFVDAGVLVEKDLKTKEHWWCEFFVNDVGWIPFDLALASGMQWDTWNETTDAKAFYFGSLDSQHIMISRGVNNIQATSASAKIVMRPKTYALQTIWEEASKQIARYSSLWPSPIVLGVY